MSEPARFYQERGFYLARNAVPAAKDWAHIVAQRSENLRRVDYTDPRGETAGGIGGRLCYEVGDALWCDRNLPTIPALYEHVQRVAARSAGPVDLSPHPRSRYVVKVYRAPDGGQGWHYDTNSVTALLYLSDNPDGATRLQALDGQTYTVFPACGDLLLFQGRKCWHRSDPVRTGAKVVIPFNLYTPGEYTRPDGLDDVIYGAAAPKDSHET